MDDRSGEASPAQIRGMRAATLGQAFGAVGGVAFTNGLLLLYLAKLGFGGPSALVVLALPSLIQPWLLLPLAHRADHHGKRDAAVRGTVISAAGFAILVAAGWCAGTLASALAVAGIAVYSWGSAQLTAPWFSLLGTLVPPSMRGAYFGRMRMAWQSTSLGFGVLCTFLLGAESPTSTLQIILGLITASMIGRALSMRRIPELDQPEPPGMGLIGAIVDAARAPGYAPFCCYVFLLTLFTANVATLLALVERDAVGFGDRALVWMGNLLGIGSVLGFWLGGRLVDRVGTKPMFLICHGAYGAIFVAVLARDLVPLPAVAWLGTINAAYGVVAAASSVAISTEMLALVPPAHRSVSTGLCSTLSQAGGGLAGLLSAGAIRLGIFNEHWTLAGETLSAYDTVLLLDAVLVVLLVVTLGLVPSVMRRADLAPAKGD